jgi:outer membrane protein assembly factor BamA
MHRPFLPPLTAVLIVFASMPLAGQQFQPKSIQFKGDPEYSNKELMAAAGLKAGAVLSYAEMNDHSKLLMDTGVFASLAFQFNGQDLIFEITPSTELVPTRLDNLPLTPGKELDDMLHAQIPLYHGKVPSEGGLTEAVRGGLEKILAAQGIHANVVATTVVDPHLRHVTAVNYSITSPPVQVAVTSVEGVSSGYQTELDGVAREAAKTPFDAENSEGNLERAIEMFYQDRGYAAVKVHAARRGGAVVNSDSIVVPFSVSIEEGKVYKVGSVRLPAGTPVTQAEEDKTLAPRIGGPTEGVRLRGLWILIATKYKSKGNLDCKITPHPQLDDAAGLVNYEVEVDPGPVYHLGFVKFDNVSDQMRTLLIHNWEMLPGDPFDENYVSNFIAKIQQTDPVLKRSLAGVKVKFDADADPHTHDVNVVIRLEKP